MTSSSGYYPYLDLVQTYSVEDLRYVPSPATTYHPSSISGFLDQSKDFRIFLYLMKIAKIDGLASQQQFRCTLFACPDAILRNLFGGDDFFMNLDRDSATKLINYHILSYQVDEKTLRQQTLSMIKTRNADSLLTFINNGDSQPILINGPEKRGFKNQARIISKPIQLGNGVVYAIDSLLLPESF